MTSIQWIERYLARRRKAAVGTPPFPESDYRRRCAGLTRLRACTDQPPDEVCRFHFRLKEGAWTVTGTRANIERQLQREIASYDAWNKRLHAWQEDEYRRYEQRRKRMEQQRERMAQQRLKALRDQDRLRNWGRIISTVVVFVFKCILLLIVLAFFLLCLVLPPLLFAIPTMLDETLGRR